MQLGFLTLAVVASLVVGVKLVFGSTCAIGAFGIQLQPQGTLPASFLQNPPLATLTNVTRSRTLPRIIVQIVDSAGNVDVSVNDYLQVRVTGSDPSVALTGALQTVYNGEAHFIGLSVDNVLAGLTFRLIFRVEPVTAYTVAAVGKSAVSGPMFMLTGIQNEYSIKFMPSNSWVQRPGAPVEFVSGLRVPPIAVGIYDSASNLYVQQASLGSNTNHSIIASFASDVSLPPGTFLSGTVGVIVQGIATFRQLTITTTSAATTFPPLLFTYFSQSTTTIARSLQVKTGVLTSVSLVQNRHIAFDAQDVSFIHTDGQSFTATSGVPLPPIQISLRDTVLQPSPPSTGLVITATIPAGPAGSARLTGNVVGVVGGVAVFDALTFDQIDHRDVRPYVITFTAGRQGSLPLAGSQLVTGIVLVSNARTPAQSFRFRQNALDSFFTSENVDVLVTQGALRLPVQLELLDSSNSLDTNTTSVSVAAIQSISSSGETVLATQTFVGGRLTFPQLSLSQPQDASAVVQLLFRGISSASDPAGSQTLQTGRLNVTTELRNYDIQFLPYGSSLISSSGQPTFGTTGTPLPTIVIQIVTSAGNVDTQSDEIGITATSDGGAILSGAFVRVTGGIAAFTALTFVSENPGTFHITFTAGTEANTLVAGKSVTTGDVEVVTAVTPKFNARFTNTSYIAFSGQTVPFLLGAPIPNVSVTIVDSAHAPYAASLGNVTGKADPLLQATVALSGGFKFSSRSGPTTVPIIDGVATFVGLIVDAAFQPTLSVCIRSTKARDRDPVNGICVSSGSLITYTSSSPIGALALLPSSVVGYPVNIDRQYGTITINQGAVMTAAIGIVDVTGVFTQVNRNLPPISIAASSNIPLTGNTRVAVNQSSGVARFTDLQFGVTFPSGVTPFITFSVVTDSSSSDALLAVQSIASGLITTQQVGQTVGVEVVAEILADYDTFSFTSWRSSVAARLAIEPERISLLYIAKGTSAPNSQGAVTADTTYQRPSWQGTRVEMLVLPPLSTSRLTTPADTVAEFFVSLRPSCLVGELLLRDTYLKADDKSCDWYIFDAQMDGVRSCIQARGKSGYCACHVPLFAFMGLRCLGLPRMTDLCLNTLLNSDAASCKALPIVQVCKLLQFPDVPRTSLAGIAAFMFLFLPPLAYLYVAGFFHSLGIPPDAQVQTFANEARGRPEDQFDFL